jgi:arsenate reductase
VGFGLGSLAFGISRWEFSLAFHEDPRPKSKDPSTHCCKVQMSDDNITVYEKPTCTKCREMNRFLVDNGVDFSKVNYYIEPLTKQKLTELLGKMKLTPRDILRTSEGIYKELELRTGEFTDDEIIDLMIKHPDLIQRPIVERGNRAVLGRPTENVKTLL